MVVPPALVHCDFRGAPKRHYLPKTLVQPAAGQTMLLGLEKALRWLG